MQKPNLDRMWQVWIKVGVPLDYQDGFNRTVNVIGSQVREVISVLEARDIVDWYQFLVHGKEKDENLYCHIRFSLRENVNSKDFLNLLPKYCINPKHIERKDAESISGIMKRSLKNDEIEEAWRIIGEQSEWIIHLVNAHKDGKMSIEQFVQFMHFYMNMVGLGKLSVFLPSPLIRF